MNEKNETNPKLKLRFKENNEGSTLRYIVSHLESERFVYFLGGTSFIVNCFNGVGNAAKFIMREHLADSVSYTNDLKIKEEFEKIREYYDNRKYRIINHENINPSKELSDILVKKAFIDGVVPVKWCIDWIRAFDISVDAILFDNVFEDNKRIEEQEKKLDDIRKIKITKPKTKYYKHKYEKLRSEEYDKQRNYEISQYNNAKVLIRKCIDEIDWESKYVTHFQ